MVTRTGSGLAIAISVPEWVDGALHTPDGIIPHDPDEEGALVEAADGVLPTPVNDA